MESVAQYPAAPAANPTPFDAPVNGLDGAAAVGKKLLAVTEQPLSAVMVNITPHWWEDSAAADRLRVLEFGAGELEFAVIHGRNRPFLADKQGYWEPLDTENPGATGVLENVILNARNAAVGKAIAELRDNLPSAFQRMDDDQARELADKALNSFTRTARHYRAVAALLDHPAQFTEQYNAKLIPYKGVDDRDANPLFPVQGRDDSINLRTGEQYTPDQVKECLLLRHKWEGCVAPRYELLQAGARPRAGGQVAFKGPEFIDGEWRIDVAGTSDHPDADVMAWFINEHFGAGLFRRLAWSISGIRPVVDTLINPTSGSGKGTLIAVLQATLGDGAVSSYYAPRTLSRRAAATFTGPTDNLTYSLLTILDEMDKIDGGPVPGLLNDLCEPNITIHRKGRDPYSAPRCGNAWLFGGGWIRVDLTVQGTRRRTEFCWLPAKRGKDYAITGETRRRLLSPDATGFLMAWLLNAAAQLDELGEDGRCAESESDTAEWRMNIAEPTEYALARLCKPGLPQEFVSNAEIAAAITELMGLEGTIVAELPKGKAWGAMVSRYAPYARPTQQGKERLRGWKGLVLRDAGDVAHEGAEHTEGAGEGAEEEEASKTG